MLRMDSHNILNGQANLNASPGQYAGFMLRLDAVSGAGATLTAADLGLVTVRYAGRVIGSVPWDARAEMNNMDGGVVEASYGAAGGNPLNASVFIPASRSGDGNIFDVASQDHMVITVDLSGVTAAKAASGTLTLLGVPAEGTQLYVQQEFTQQPSISASSTEILPLRAENVAFIYLHTLTNLSSIQVKRDKEMIADCNLAEIQALSNYDSRLESAYSSGIRIPLQPSGALTEALSDDVTITLTAGSGGAAAPRVIAVAMDFTPAEYARSKTLVVAKAQAKLRRKREMGKGRAVEVINALQGA